MNEEFVVRKVQQAFLLGTVAQSYTSGYAQPDCGNRGVVMGMR